MSIVPKDEGKIASSIAPASTTLSYSTSGNHQEIHLPPTASRNLFTGKNLYQWRRFVERMLRPCKLDDHLVKSRPKEEDANYFTWVDEEDILIILLLDSMKPELSDRFIDYKSVKDLWDAVIKLYSTLEDELRMAELTKKAMELLQEQRSVIEYSNELNALWSEIDFYWPLPTDPKGRNYILKGRTYRFLTGLRAEFETIRTLLLHRENSLSFDESVVRVIQVECRIKAMQTQFSTDNQAFLIKNTSLPTPLTPGQPKNMRYTQGFNAKQSLHHSNYTGKTH